MEKNIEKAVRLESISREIFKRIGCEVFSNLRDNKVFGDFFVNRNNERYVVEVKRKYTPFILGWIINKLKSRDNINGDKFILMIFDRVSEDVRNKIEEYGIILLDISNILYIIYNDVELLRLVTTILDFSIDSIPLIKNELDLQINEFLPETNLDLEKIKINEYKEKLAKLSKGKSSCKLYEELIEDILKYIFSSKIEFKEQYSTSERLNIFDMIGKIKNGTKDDFFQTVEMFFKSKYIIFEFKNYSQKITQEQVCTTEKYLYRTALRMAGIIVTRIGIDSNGQKMAEGILRENGKIILVLNDNDVSRMLDLYLNNEEPSIVFMEKLDNMLTKLEK